jgi:hypothetical protein
VAEEMRKVKGKMQHTEASKYVTHGLRKNATIELYRAGCDDEMVKAVTWHSGVEMLKNMVGRYVSGSWQRGCKKPETRCNRTGPERESFNGSFNFQEGDKQGDASA